MTQAEAQIEVIASDRLNNSLITIYVYNLENLLGILDNYQVKKRNKPIESPKIIDRLSRMIKLRIIKQRLLETITQAT
nr:MAG: hypothetical protein EDM05_05005 [Leptolyngbya sp. IPPAS B-1204]